MLPHGRMRANADYYWCARPMTPALRARKGLGWLERFGLVGECVAALEGRVPASERIRPTKYTSTIRERESGVFTATIVKQWLSSVCQNLEVGGKVEEREEGIRAVDPSKPATAGGSAENMEEGAPVAGGIAA